MKVSRHSAVVPFLKRIFLLLFDETLPPFLPSLSVMTIAPLVTEIVRSALLLTVALMIGLMVSSLPWVCRKRP